MKLFLLITVVFVSLVTMTSSCTKETTTVVNVSTTNDSAYYVKATINGVNVVYNGYTAALYRTSQLDVYGYTSSANAADGIDLDFQCAAAYFPMGIYTDTSATNPYHSVTIYFQQSGIQYYDFHSPTTPGIFATITAINDSSVTGTFSAIVSYYNNTRIDAITNGSFHVPF